MVCSYGDDVVAVAMIEWLLVDQLMWNSHILTPHCACTCVLFFLVRSMCSEHLMTCWHS